MNWKYDSYLKYWLTGTYDDGCGVGEESEGWTANIVILNSDTNLGYFNSKEEAMEAAEEFYKRNR